MTAVSPPARSRILPPTACNSSQRVYRSGLIMRPVFDAPRPIWKRVIYAWPRKNGCWRCRASSTTVRQTHSDRAARRIEQRIAELGLRIRPDQDFEIIDPRTTPTTRGMLAGIPQLRGHYKVDPNKSPRPVNTRATVIGALMLRLGYGDAFVVDYRRFSRSREYVLDIVGLREGVKTPAASEHVDYFARTVVLRVTPTSTLTQRPRNADITLLAAEGSRPFPAAENRLLSHSSFGSYVAAGAQDGGGTANHPPARTRSEVDGEMRGDAALSEELRSRVFLHSQPKGVANLLIIMPKCRCRQYLPLTCLRERPTASRWGPIMLGLPSWRTF